MSIQLFPGIVPNTLPAISAESGAEFSGAYAEYQIKIGILSGGIAGRVRAQVVDFGIREITQALCDEKAYVFAELLTSCTGGVLLAMVKVMGKYRNDVMPESIEAGKTLYGQIMLTNGRVSSSDVSPEPHRKLDKTIFVPFANRVKFMELLEDVERGNLGLATSRFETDNKNSFVIGMLPKSKGFKLLDFQQAKSFGLVNNDETSGGLDGVVSKNPS